MSLQKVESHVTTAMNPFCDDYQAADPGPQWEGVWDTRRLVYSVPYMFVYILRAFVYVSVCVCVNGSRLFLPMTCI